MSPPSHSEGAHWSLDRVTPPSVRWLNKSFKLVASPSSQSTRLVRLAVRLGSSIGNCLESPPLGGDICNCNRIVCCRAAHCSACCVGEIPAKVRSPPLLRLGQHNTYWDEQLSFQRLSLSSIDFILNPLTAQVVYAVSLTRRRLGLSMAVLGVIPIDKL